jgi:hypothetical protein
MVRKRGGSCRRNESPRKENGGSDCTCQSLSLPPPGKPGPVLVTVPGATSDALTVRSRLAPNYRPTLGTFVAESKVFRVHSDLVCLARFAAASICVISACVNRAERRADFSNFMPIGGRPNAFLFFFVIQNH